MAKLTIAPIHIYGFIAIIFALLLAVNHKIDSLYDVVEEKISKDTIIVEDLPELTKSNLITYICKKEIKHPLIVYYQAMIETGWLKCTNCSLDYNNLFGLTPKANKYIKFYHWTASVDYYKNWQDKYYSDSIDYYTFLNCLWIRPNGTPQRYAEDPDYTRKLKSLVK